MHDKGNYNAAACGHNSTLVFFLLVAEHGHILVAYGHVTLLLTTLTTTHRRAFERQRKKHEFTKAQVKV